MVRAKKKGLFLSVELVAVIIVVATLVAAVAMSAGYIFSMYKQHVIINEIKMYTEAYTKFTELYDYYPGEIPAAELDKGGPLKNSVVHTTTTSFSASPDIPSVTQFQSMAAAGLIPTRLVQLRKALVSGGIGGHYASNPLTDTSGTALYVMSQGNNSSSTTPLKLGDPLHAGSIFPISAYDDDLVWYAKVSLGSNYNAWYKQPGFKLATAGYAQLYYNNNTGEGNADVLTLPGLAKQHGLNDVNRVMILTRMNAVIGSDLSHSFTNWHPGVNYNTVSYSFFLRSDGQPMKSTLSPSVTAMSSSDTYNLDLKIDDGKPHTGLIMAEGAHGNVGGLTIATNTCHNWPQKSFDNAAFNSTGVLSPGPHNTGLTPTTAWWATNATYRRETIFRPDYGCALIIKLA